MHPSVVNQLADSDPIWAERGKAIQAYALLEQALCELMQDLSGTNAEAASIIFYKITSTGSRNAIIEKLLRRKHGKKYNLFWNSYLKELRPIDIRRNEIVHWLSASLSATDYTGAIICGVILIPPGAHAFSHDADHISSLDLQNFSTKCDEFARLCRIFIRVSNLNRAQDGFDTWLDIFQKPFLYPLPKDHLLSQMSSAQHTQPPPSPV